MPNAALTAAIQEAYATAPADSVVLHTLEFNHPSFSTPIRVVRDQVDLIATLENTAPYDAGAAVTFVAYAFDFAPPEVGAGGMPEITITIDNVARDLIGYIDTAVQTPDLIQVIYRPYLSNDLSGPHMNPPMQLTIRTIECDVFQVRATAGYGDIANRRFPNELYTSDRFPGLAGQN